jgi:hypothetical protein
MRSISSAFGDGKCGHLGRRHRVHCRRHGRGASVRRGCRDENEMTPQNRRRGFVGCSYGGDRYLSSQVHVDRCAAPCASRRPRPRASLAASGRWTSAPASPQLGSAPLACVYEGLGCTAYERARCRSAAGLGDCRCRTAGARGDRRSKEPHRTHVMYSLVQVSFVTHQ